MRASNLRSKRRNQGEFSEASCTKAATYPTFRVGEKVLLWAFINQPGVIVDVDNDSGWAKVWSDSKVYEEPTFCLTKV